MNSLGLRFFVEDDLFCYPDITPSRVSDVLPWNEKCPSLNRICPNRRILCLPRVTVFYMDDRAASFILGLSFEGMALDVILLVTIRTRFADLNFVDKDDVNGATAVQFGSDRTRFFDEHRSSVIDSLVASFVEDFTGFSCTVISSVAQISLHLG